MKTQFWLINLMLLLINIAIRAQNPLNSSFDAVEMRYSTQQPVVSYTLTIDAKDLSSYAVEMHVGNVQDTFRIAMVAHPEYDDRFWRYIQPVTAESSRGQVCVVTREDSAVWRIQTGGGGATIRYKIHLPKPGRGNRPSWVPFLSPAGGLVGGPHSFLYVVGATLAPAHVAIDLPGGWKASTGLEPTFDHSVFYAPSAAVLVDCPIFVGKFKDWSFQVDGVPHRIIYWSGLNAARFDTAALADHVQRVVTQARNLFGRLPYREFLFHFQDEAYGALEHANSVSVGLPSADIAKDIDYYLPEVAHEYFHSWNLVRIHPAEYGDVSYKHQPLSRGLWWSEGLTMYYADLLLRRAGLPYEGASRKKHLEELLTRYYENPGNTKISPEQASLASYGPKGMLGDYTVSVHLQGEIIGTVLDLMIRNATGGKKSIDDVMRAMMERYSGPKGFNNADIERLIREVGGVDASRFFSAHVYDHQSIDFNKVLALIGMQADVQYKKATGDDGKLLADTRLYVAEAGASSLILVLTDPEGCWGKAGLHTGDTLLAVNQKSVSTWREFRETIRPIRVGDRVVVAIRRAGVRMEKRVAVSGYQVAVVQIRDVHALSQKQKELREFWVEAE